MYTPNSYSKVKRVQLELGCCHLPVKDAASFDGEGERIADV